MRLGINYRKEKKKKPVKIKKDIWRLNNIPVNYQEIADEIKEEIKKY